MLNLEFIDDPAALLTDDVGTVGELIEWALDVAD